MTLFLHNTLTRKKDEFRPIDPRNVRMYVCGPTVYGRAHLGNARSVVVYDVLFRLLRHLYGAEHVTYARNITDVDDKINAAAKERRITIKRLTTEVTQWFHDDMAALNVLPATESKSSGIMLEPKATDHIDQMIKMIERLISNGKAYVAQGNVLFSVRSMSDYGKLSGRVQEELEAGARVKVEGYKRDPNDFVLWKPADADDDPSSIFDSPWGKGRPGWHIECSAMSTHYLGVDFDIHGGGSDLMFPHHENEIAQSCGATPGSHFAHYWVHNGFLTVNGEKMSKSLGNFITVRDLLEKGVKREVIRYALLSTKYNEPLNWTDNLLEASRNAVERFKFALRSVAGNKDNPSREVRLHIPPPVIASLSDDLNVPLAFSYLHEITTLLNNNKNDAQRVELAGQLAWCLAGLGFDLQAPPDNSEAKKFRENVMRFSPAEIVTTSGTTMVTVLSSAQAFFQGLSVRIISSTNNISDVEIKNMIDARIAAKKAKNWVEADRIRNELKSQGILLEDRPDGTTDWRRE